MPNEERDNYEVVKRWPEAERVAFSVGWYKAVARIYDATGRKAECAAAKKRAEELEIAFDFVCEKNRIPYKRRQSIWEAYAN